MVIFSKGFFLVPETNYLKKMDRMECENVYQIARQTDSMVLGILDKNEIKFDFLMNFRNSQISLFIPWMPIGPRHN